MELTVKELNTIYYCLGQTLDSCGVIMVDKELIKDIKDKIWDGLVKEWYKKENNDDIFVAS